MARSFLLLFFFSLTTVAQTGGTYQLEKSVIASGGNTSSGGAYSLESTTGQSIAGGFILGNPYRNYTGFWTPSLVPTAANVSIGGRVLTAAGRGIGHARVTLYEPNGTISAALTNSFGYYRFDGVPVGETYILTVSSKGFAFEAQAVSVIDEITDLDFIGAEE